MEMKNTTPNNLKREIIYHDNGGFIKDLIFIALITCFIVVTCISIYIAVLNMMKVEDPTGISLAFVVAGALWIGYQFKPRRK